MDHGMVRCSWLGMAFQFTIWLIERVQYHILWISDKQCLTLCHTISFTLAYDVRVAEFPTLFISCCVDHGTAEIDAALILRLGVAFLLPQVHNMRQYNITNTLMATQYHQQSSHNGVHCSCCTDHFWCCHWGDQRPEQGVCVWPLILVCGPTRHTLHLPGTGD